MVTKHSHIVVFGRKEDGCPRCDELRAGAKPVRWSTSKRDYEMARVRAIRTHVCSPACGSVCTKFDW